MRVYGLTGRSGSGKTTALELFRSMDVPVLECDSIVRELESPGQECLNELVREYSEEILLPSGELNRRKLAGIAFSSREQTDKLNSIVLKYVVDRVKKNISELEKEYRYCVIEAPQLFESGLDAVCDEIILITAPEKRLKERIMQRDRLDESMADMRLSAQISDEELRRRCGIIIENDKGLAEFEDRIRKIKNTFDTQNMEERKVEEKKSAGQLLQDELCSKNESAINTYGKEHREQIDEYGRDYMAFMNRSKTEREFACNAAEYLAGKGFKVFEPGKKYKAGDKIYWLNKNKSLVAAVVGKKPLDEGLLITASHIDSPRLDIRPHPLYESEGIALFKTHYYGGIKKYQWVTLPLALHGVVSKKDGTDVTICIGEDEDDPIFYISDLLPHLSRKVQGSRTAGDVINGEELNVILGTEPYDDDKVKNPVKLAVLKTLNDKYGMTEDDFRSAELEIVPAMKARYIGFDKTLIAAYGHDDKICGYTTMTALTELKKPEKTCLMILADKEEIGSIGNTGMNSHILSSFVAFLCKPYDVMPEKVFINSRCLSADVAAAFDPTFPMVNEPMNAAYLNRGPAVCKYLGSGGKGGSNDAHAEYIGALSRMWAEAGVPWQLSELGKVDEGGGGTVAAYISRFGVDTIDIGVPLLSMHSPYEVCATLDLFTMNRAALAFYENM